MKYLTFYTGQAKPAVILFSSEIEHWDIATHLCQLPGFKKILSAGFVTIPNARAHTGGFSTSLHTGPADYDIDKHAIEFDLEKTAHEYPAPPQSTAAAYPWGSDILPKEEVAAIAATSEHAGAIISLCMNCGMQIHGDRPRTMCAGCETIYFERKHQVR